MHVSWFHRGHNAASALVLVSFAVFAHAAEDRIVIPHPTAPLTEADIVSEIAGLPETRRSQLQTSPALAENLARELHLRRLVAEQQRRQGVDQSGEVAVALRLQSERMLFDAFLQSVDARLPGEPVLEKLAAEDYKANPDKFKSSEELRVRHILIRTSRALLDQARELAESLLRRAKAGEPFDALARKYSDDAGSAEKGGDLGFIGRGKTVAEFEKAAFSLKSPGDLAPIFESQFGFHVVRLEERRAPKLMPFEEVKGQLVDAIRMKLRNQARADAAGAFRSSEWEINQQALRAAIGTR